MFGLAVGGELDFLILTAVDYCYSVMPKSSVLRRKQWEKYDESSVRRVL